MGCDIHSYVEVKGGDGRWGYDQKTFPTGGQYTSLSPFDWRSYGLYGFLADVRNYSKVPPISPQKGFPEDAGEYVTKEYEHWSADGHSASWLTLKELLDFDYDQEMEDRRCTRQLGPNSWSGGETCEPGEGKKLTFREFLGELYFKNLDVLKTIGTPEEVRVVFWFDN